MKKTTLIIVLLASVNLAMSQTWKAGLGIQTFSQPFAGVFIEADYNQAENNKFETITRFSLGFRSQTIEHKSVNLEIHRGYRLRFRNSFYVEQTVGLGVMQSFYSESYWYKNDWHNLIYVGKSGRTLDVMPSVSIGLGHYFGGENGDHNHVWIRPKAFFQLPNNNPSNVNFTLQFGYSISLSK
ncbi:MAG: hypothetical protein JXR19_07645 [Bacteroidia bacterium]